MLRRTFAHTLSSLVIVASLTVQPLLAQPARGAVALAPVPLPAAMADSAASPLPTVAQAEPAAAAPLAVVKSQSTFEAGGLLAVTYTLRNLMAPELRPDVAPGADVTTTTAAILATDFADDPNVIHGAALALELTGPPTAFHSASLPVERDGAILAVNLGDLPPLGEASVVITVTTPANAADFTNLDAGAEAFGDWRGRAVSAQAGPIRLAPDGLAQWLVCTPDANCNDPVVQRQASTLGSNPAALFTFVRGLGYESYAGSLRGARGTLWSAAGNGYDQASALIALLRASGIPAAYRLGTLSQGDAQTLIESMFPPVSAVSGLVPPGAETANPANDPTLITEAQDHAWVEAYLPGSGWTALDPSFSGAAVGQVFGTPTGGQLAELPDGVRHKVTLALEVEKYSAFPVGGTNLYRTYPLTATLNTVELVGEPVVFAHLVASSNPPGLVYATAEHTYTPYFVVGASETLIEGAPFSELISSFPFAQDFVVAEWLNLTATGPDGSSDTYQRELFDDIGYAVRTQGGLVDDLDRDGTARLSLMSSWTTLFSPSAVPLEALNDTYQAMVDLSLEGIAASEAIEGVADTENPTPEEVALGTATATTYGLLARLAQRQHLLQYAAAADQAHATLAENLLVRAYPDSPRIFTVGWERDDTTQTETISFDLGRNPLRVLAHPGQTDVGRQGFAFWRGLLDMSLEHELLAAIAPEPVVSVAAVFNQAIAADLEFERVTLGTLDDLDALPLSAQAKARISTALVENPDLYVLVPAEMVTLPGASEPTIGWIQVDQITLEVVDVMENGQHLAALEYAPLGLFSQKIASFLGGFAAGFFSYVMGFWIGFFAAMPLGSQDIQDVIAASKASAEAWGNKAKKACNKKSDKKWCKAGVGAGNALGAAIIGDDPPLQDALFSLPVDAPLGNAQASALVAETASLSGNTISANLSTALVGVHGTADFAWTTGAASSFAFEQLTLSAAQVYSGGVLLASGPVTATPSAGAAVALAGAGVTVDGSGSGNLALHAPALDDLGAGSQWASYAFTLDSAGSYTLTLTGATVTVDGTNYTGSLDLVTSSPALLQGNGAAAVPDFAASVDIDSAGAGFTVADASGTLTVGGSPAPAANGFVLGNASGTAGVDPAGASTDAFTFSGTGDFFAVTLDSASSSIPANGTASFDADVAANFAGTYTMTVFAPDGWDVSVDAAGEVTAAPPLGAAPDDYLLIVTAQSAAYPALLASAEHTVTVTGVDGVQVSVALDPLITVPWGPAHDVINFDPLEGRVQLAGAAFAATITNTSSSARTFDVDVSGLPSGWVILGGIPGSEHLEIELAAGEVVRLGLYISPTVSSLPAPGTNYPFDVTATAQDNGGVTETDDGLFTMPAVAYPALTVDPAELFTASNSDAAFTLTVSNIGNVAGDFPLEGTVPVSGWQLSTLQSPVSLSPGASASQAVTVSVTVGDAAADHPVAIGAGAPGLPYTPTTAVDVYVVGPLSSPVFEAAQRIAAECPLNFDNLSGALETLAFAMSSLEGSCADGDCILFYRDEVVSALEGAAYYAGAASPLVTTAAPLSALAAAMAGHTSDVDLEQDLADISAAVDDLSAEVCELCQHQPALRWSPAYDAGLPGMTVTYTLEIENQGTVTTTYFITLTLPSGNDSFTTTVAPGATDLVTVPTSALALGLHDLMAEATAAGPDVTLPDLTTSALGRLNVVDRFVQVTAVTADPAFVETGVSSTTLSVDVTNVANVARTALARTSILEPGGGITNTNDITLTVLVGAPRTYALGTVDTSGWAEGVYTVTVDLLDADADLIPDGSGYGYFAVGQALVASQAVSPTLVAPGTATVTTVITTEIQADLPFAPDAPPNGGAVPAPVLGSTSGPVVFGGDPAWGGRPRYAPVAAPVAQPLFAVAGLTRTEQNSTTITYSGAWSGFNSTLASGGSYTRSAVLSATAEFAFDGAWINLGFLGGPASGKAEVYLDGASQGTIDLYRREDTALSFVYDAFAAGPHTLTVTVLATRHVNSTANNVQFDYVDVWDGTALPDGTFEQDDERVYLSTGWGNVNDADASGGSLVDSSAATAWFIFIGDSVTYQALARSNGGRVRVYLDGQYQTTQDLYAAADITRTLSFTGLVSGPHILQVSTYWSEGNVDAFLTPGVAPFFTPTVPAGFTRYEDDDPALLYNGLPFTQTAQTWSRSNPNLLISGWTSAGQFTASGTPSDTVSLTFDGVWVSVGFSGEEDSGRAEIYIDGLSQGIVDLYRNESDSISFTYDGLLTGTHTLSITVLGTQNPLANGDAVSVDYIDVWDGAALASGSVEQDDARVYRSSGWGQSSHANASGGTYLSAGLNATAWFAFTDDSVTFQAFDTSGGDQMVLRLDGQFADYADIHVTTNQTHTYSFDGLSAGVHVLQVRQYRNTASMDAFHAPAITPAAPPLTPTVFTRYEEDDPAILYNGLPYTITARSWDRFDNVTYASDGQHFGADVDADTVSFDFSGTWVRAGFITGASGGQVEVFIDGTSQGTVELYTRDAGTLAETYSGLADTSHTISVTLLSTQHPNASNNWLYVDYFDTWDGTSLPSGTYEEDAAEVWRGSTHEDWTSTANGGASGGSYLTRNSLQPDSRLWFAFTGDSIAYQGMANTGGGRVTLVLDDVSQGTFNLYNASTVTRTFAFEGLGAGPHMLEVRYYRGAPTLDALIVPGAAPFFTTPVYTGVVRYEEDHPALVYGSAYDWARRPQAWSLGTNASQVSGARYVAASTVSQTVSLTFSGRWVSAGFRAVNGTSQARVFIDGVDQGLVDMDVDAEDVISFAYGDLITGTHTISVAVAAGTVNFDYFDVWDGQAMSDDFQNARLAEDSGRLHYGTGLADDTNPAAAEGDLVRSGLLNSNATLWYTFVGDSFTLLAVSRTGGGTVNVQIDGVLTDTVDLEYPFSETPFAVHYGGLEYGPHTVAVRNGLNLRVDGFSSNPASLFAYEPRAEWWDNSLGVAGVWGGIISPIAVGDLDEDGLVELVASSAAPPPYNGTVAVYRGDGQDTGDGDPILWSVSYPALVGFAAFESMPSVAIGDLDGETGAEVVVPNPHGLYVYHADGSSYWFTDTIQTFRFFGSPAIGNLDLEPLPEIVANGDDRLSVYEHDGALAWSVANIDGYHHPVLADLTGDGLLDILAVGGDDTLTLWDYNFGTPQLEWTVAFTEEIAVYGGPAVADIDGQQGGDLGPEIAVAISGTLHILDADGTPVWTVPLDPGRPGGVSIADLDGDGEVEILASTQYDGGRLVAYNADGTVLWNIEAVDNSPANASLMDLDGDGDYEVAWIGPDGLFLFDGVDGSLLFDEPAVTSLTGLDFPVFADVDLDGYGELVVPGHSGPRIFGWDGVWGEARPLWNQHSYHITNINDDLSVPVSELNSWEAHNTFRTQFPASVVLPVYDVSLAYTEGLSSTQVLTDTFNVTPTLSADPLFTWDYTQTWADTAITRTFNSTLTDLRPGEARRVSEGTEVTYTLPSGTNHLTLPPLYVSVPHIIALSPETRTVGAGGVVTYAVELSNPAVAADTYTLTVSGVPGGWAALPASVPVSGQSAVTVTLTITVPADTAPASLLVIVTAENEVGGSDQAQAALDVIELLEVDLSPAAQTAETGAVAAYTLTVTNHEAQVRTYDLYALGLADVTLPPTMTVPAGDSASVLVLASANTEGPHPFTVMASSSLASGSDSATLETSGQRVVGLDLAPPANAAGPGSTAIYTLTVTNLGTVTDTYDLSTDLPSGWTAQMDTNGTPVSAISLPPDLFNSAQVRLAVSPDAAAAPGLYVIEVMAQSQALPGVTATVTATLEVLNHGVQVALSPAHQTLNPVTGGQWQVTITNTGSVADVFDLTPVGIVALTGQFTANPVALNPGQSTVVDLNAGGFGFALPATYPIGVAAVSQGDDRAQDEATASLTFDSFEAVQVSWNPISQTVSGSTAGLVLVLTNTANVSTIYALTLDAPGLSGGLAQVEIDLPAHATALLPLFVEAAAPGTYSIEAQADSTTSPASGSATASITFNFEAPPPQMRVYLPYVSTQEDDTPLLFERIFLPLVSK